LIIQIDKEALCLYVLLHAMDDITYKLTKFKEETGMDFFDAVPRFYEYIPEELLPFVPFTEEQIGNCFEQVYNSLLSIINDRANRRETIN
jgi:hypothetical protein